MTWFRMPLFLWGLYATAIIQILATPVLGITLLLLIVERAFGIGIFDPALGGDPILFQHFFWFYSHPAVYIMILPGDGRDQRAGLGLLPQAHLRLHVHRHSQSIAIAVLGFLVWGHHMFVTGQSTLSSMIFCVPDVHGGDSLGRQGVQLAGHDVQGLDLAGDADALRALVPLPVRHRRA